MVRSQPFQHHILSEQQQAGTDIGSVRYSCSDANNMKRADHSYHSTTYRSEVHVTPITAVTTSNEHTAEIEAGHSVTIQLPVRLLATHKQYKHILDSSYHSDVQDTTAADKSRQLHHNNDKLTEQVVQEGDPCTPPVACNGVTSGSKQGQHVEANNNDVEETDEEVEYIAAVADRHLEWVAASNELDESEEEPRYSYPTHFTRRDSMDRLIEEAKQAYMQQTYMQQTTPYFQPINQTDQSLTDTHSNDSTQFSDTYSDESRSSCSTFDLSEQTEDSEPRLVIPKLYDREESMQMDSAQQDVNDFAEIKTFERVPSFIQGNDENHPLPAI